MISYYIADVETFWAKDYTLRSMTPEEYIRDARFHVHGWGIKPLVGKAMWFAPHEFDEWAAGIDWKHTALICHNTRFDGAILSWKHRIRPRLWVDTMGMYRALHPELRRYSLEALAKQFNLGVKGAAVAGTCGKRVLTSAEYAQLGEYCATGEDSDCALTERLFVRAWARFPPFERLIMDMTIRTFTEPRLLLDPEVLHAFLRQHAIEKAQLLHDCGLDKKSLMSADKFADALRKLGVEPPLKPSPTHPEKEIYAFAKTDEAMTDLAEHEDPRVQLLVSARLGHKSTIMETRCQRLISISERGPLPVPLNYWGAKMTGRHSGGDKINLTNLPRGSVLRKAIVAPPGFMIVVGDSSNIELRVMMALAGQEDVLEKIRYYDSIPEKERTSDLYCDFAGEVYGRTITRKDKAERDGVGKVGMLSLQYMTGAPKFQTMVRLFVLKENAKRRAADPNAPLMTYPEIEECMRIVNLYRMRMHRVKGLWNHCERNIIPAIVRGQAGVPVDVNGWFCTTENGFSLPGEVGVQYAQLHRGEDGWRFKSERGMLDLYGAKVAQHMTQHGARQIVMHQALLVGTRYPVVHSVYDEVVSCVREEVAEDCAQYMRDCLATAPRWAEGKIPLACEVGIGKSYGAAK